MNDEFLMKIGQTAKYINEHFNFDCEIQILLFF